MARDLYLRPGVTRATIGITTGVEPMTAGGWTELVPGAPFAYARAVECERTAVKSFHHQGLRMLGDGLRPTGFSLLDDGIVEAIELADRPFALGVLWHPEEDERSRVVGALVAAARERGAVGAP